MRRSPRRNRAVRTLWPERPARQPRRNGTLWPERPAGQPRSALILVIFSAPRAVLHPLGPAVSEEFQQISAHPSPICPG
jgi:hypothetical protein